MNEQEVQHYAETESQYEWCVMHRLYPDDPHRGPIPEAEARAWIRGWVEDGGRGDTFYVARRVVGPWQQFDGSPDA